MIRVKRIHDPASPEDGKRVYVDRLWPRGLKKSDALFDEWLKEISPSTELRKWYSHDPEKWGEFKKRYKKELEDKKEILEKLKKEAKRQNLTLLYSTKETEYNNAIALKEFLG